MSGQTHTVNVRFLKIGFLHLLTLILVIAKVTGHLDWPWIFVFTPAMLPIFVIVVLAVAFALFVAAVKTYAAWVKCQRRRSRRRDR